MLMEGPCWRTIQPWGLMKGALQNCSTDVVGIWGALRDEAKEKINKRSLLETVTGNFNSLMSQKDSLFYLSRTAPQKRLSTVNRAACQAAPRVREAQTSEFPC